MNKLFKPVISFFRLYGRIKNFRIAYRLLPDIFTPAIKTTIKVRGNNVFFVSYNKSFTKNQIKLFGRHGELLLKFVKVQNISFADSDKKNELISIQINGKNIFIQAFDYNSLKVIEEIFIDQLYDFSTGKDYVVCDVGMNVAAASLYFSSFDNIKRVYGYEPFPDTYAIANDNIDLNGVMKQKIETFNYGLGKTNKSLEVPNPPNGFLGGTTTDFVIEQLPDKFKTDDINIEIKNVCDEIRKVKEKHPADEIILKLDCEGAEYEIIDALNNNNMLRDISIYMIEFHLRGKKKLVDVLFKNQFLIISPVSDDVNFYGMLYAVKQ